MPTPSASSRPGSGGLSTGAKTGIGVGAALGAIILALIAFAVGRYGLHVRLSRFRHVENVSTHNPDENPEGGAINRWFLKSRGTTDEKGDVPPGYPVESPELHGQHIPSYTGELEGSPCPERRELL